MVRLEAEIQGLISVINDQHRYILELHDSQSQQLQYIPNTHLGPDNLYRGGFTRHTAPGLRVLTSTRPTLYQGTETILHHNV